MMEKPTSLPLESEPNIPISCCSIDVFPAGVTMSRIGHAQLAGAPENE